VQRAADAADERVVDGLQLGGIGDDNRVNCFATSAEQVFLVEDPLAPLDRPQA